MILYQPEDLLQYIQLCHRIDRKWYVRHNFNSRLNTAPNGRRDFKQSNHNVCSCNDSGNVRQHFNSIGYGSSKIQKGSTKEWKNNCFANRFCYNCNSDSQKSSECTAPRHKSADNGSKRNDVTFNINSSNVHPSHSRNFRSGNGRDRA